MFDRIKSKVNKMRTNDQGSAIVVVILAIAFVGMLVAMMAYMSYMNFIMKATDRSAKDNFYSAETALDEINVGLQSDVSHAMTNAYTDVMKLAAQETDDKRREEFRKAFSSELIKTLKVSVDGTISEYPNANPSGYAVQFENRLKSYWQETPVKGVTSDGAGGTITYGAELVLKDRGHEDVCRFVYDLDKQTVTLKGLKITYTDAKGFVSIIETDIVVTVPDIDFAASADLPDLLNYTLIASTHTSLDEVYYEKDKNRKKTIDTSVDTDISSQFNDYSLYESVTAENGGTTEIDGKVYGGRKGIFVNNNTTVIFDKGNAARAEVTASSLNATNNGKIVTGASGESVVTNVENINLDASSVELNGITNVRDDLNLDGRAGYSRNGKMEGSIAKLKGSYFGYGDTGTKSQNSSSILLNGAKCTLDISELDSFVLRGYAFVGAKHYNPRTNLDSDYQEKTEDVDNVLKQLANYSLDNNKKYVIANNGTDIILGQSLATKSDQLLYMVPSECMVYDTYDPDSSVPNHVATGNRKKQVLAKNPLSYSDYLKYASEMVTSFDSNGNKLQDSSGHDVKRHRYEMCNLDRSFAGLDTNVAATYGASFVPVVRKVSGNWLVYYYIQFDTATHANQYFADYFEANPDALSRYANEYIKDIKLGTTMSNAISSGDVEKFAIAGNMITVGVENGERVYRLAKSTIDKEMTVFNADQQSKAQEYTVQSEELLNRYLGISHYLINDINRAPADANKYTIRDNTIEPIKTIRQLVGGKTGIYYFTKKILGATENYVVAAVVLNYEDDAVNLSDIKYVKNGKTYYPSFIYAEGDIIIDRNNKGLIFCKNATITASCEKLESDAENALACLTAKYKSNSFYQVLVNGISYVDITGIVESSEEAAALAKEREKDYVVISDLIQYDNWKKE